MKNIYEGVLLLMKLQATKSDSSPWVLFTFFKCTNGYKSCKASHIVKGTLGKIYTRGDNLKKIRKRQCPLRNFRVKTLFKEFTSVKSSTEAFEQFCFFA